MKKHTVLLTALFSLLLAELFIGQARERIHPALESPAGFSAIKHSRDGRGFNEHKMYPLGFSKRGEFAYLVYSSTPWRQPTIYLRVLNLITDQQIHWDVFDMPSKEADEAIRVLVSMHGKKISDVLYQFDIVASPDLHVRQFPLRFDGDLVAADVHRRFLTDKSIEECGNGTPEEVEIRLKSEKNGVKVIASYDTCASNAPFIEAIEGFIKSPLEDRIVVLAAGTQYNSSSSWEAKFFPIGAHLTEGF
jgi:hypothetical protein